MKIGQLARLAQVNIQTLRYYDRIGLLPPKTRTVSGYREYQADAVSRVLFIKRSQDLGFALSEIKELLSLRGASVQSRQVVRRKASRKLDAIREKIVELKKLEATLKKLITDCEHGDVSGPCPILERMEGK